MILKRFSAVGAIDRLRGELGQILRQRRRHVLRPAPQTEPACDPHHGTDSLGVLAEINLLAERELRVEVIQRDSSAGEPLDQRDLDRAELIVAAEIGLDVGDKPVEHFRSVGATVELVSRKQLWPRRPF
jgi:hypothetical protein